MMSSDDEKAGDLAEALKGKTSRKILEFLSENKNVSEKDIAEELKLPLNTIEYNLKKLLKSELIEKSKKFFWSKKGKKIILYNRSKKHIVISPKSIKPRYSKLKSLIPVVLITGFIFMFLSAYFVNQVSFGTKSSEMIGSSPENIVSSFPNYLIGFILGALVGLMLYFVWSKIKKRFK